MGKSYPFSAIVGQTEMQLALMCAAVDWRIGGVLLFGDRGTGKTTAVRGLADLLPQIAGIKNCRYNCDIKATIGMCDVCRSGEEVSAKNVVRLTRPVVDLPLGATEDRLVGAMDIERALAQGEKAFEPGLLAAAHRGFLYIDEVNLLEDHLVDLLLDVAASGENLVEREGLSLKHPARFVLFGSGNPEEGELRPQLLDRFGLCVDVRTPGDVLDRVEVIRRREAFEQDATKFHRRFARKQSKLRKQITTAQTALDNTQLDDAILVKISELCVALGTDGLRGELTLMRAARAYAALSGEAAVNREHVRTMANPSLAHRLRRDPLDDVDGKVRVQRALEQVGLA